MASEEAFKPLRKMRVYDLVASAGVNVDEWERDFRGTNPATNPKFCHNWSFVQPDALVVLCLWYDENEEKEGKIYQARNYRKRMSKGSVHSQGVRSRRAHLADTHIIKAYNEGLPLRIIVLEKRFTTSRHSRPGEARVARRELDPMPWAVTSYDAKTGACVLTRGATSTPSETVHIDEEILGFEGELRSAFVKHRRREQGARAAKLAAVLREKGRLLCEVENCGFDFSERYGRLGNEYAHVHHLDPLSAAPASGRRVDLKRLAIVCANCHAMIHRGGECRPLKGLIQPRTG